MHAHGLLSHEIQNQTAGSEETVSIQLNRHGALVLYCTLHLPKQKKATSPEVVVIAVDVVTYSSA